jgi:hypothetical protein
VPINIDFTGAGEGGDYAPLEAGLYKATIESIQAGQSRAGKPKLEFTYNLTDENNRKMWKNYSLQPNALWGLKADLVTLGYEIPDGEFTLDETELIGMQVLLEISLKDAWDGATEADPDNPGMTRIKKQNDVEKVTRDTGGSW